MDNHVEGDDHVAHRLLGALPGTSYAVVSRAYYEGGEYILVNLVTGDTATVAQLPVLSPDRKRVVVASMDFEAGYHPNTLEVWLLGASQLVREFGQKTGDIDPPAGWAPSDPHWLGTDTIGFTQNVPIDGEVGRYTELPARLIRREKGWVLSTQSP